MNILLAHNFYLQPGGEDECVAAEAAMLKANGHNVIRYDVHNEETATMPYFNLAARTLWSKVAYRDLTELFRIHRPQIAHFHNIFPLISPSAYYAARRQSVRVVQTVHNFRLLCANALLYRDGFVCEDCLGRSVGWSGLARRCYRGSFAASGGITAMTAVHRAMGTWARSVDMYIALTEFARLKLIEGGLPAERIAVKSNFVHPDSGPGPGRGGYGLFVGRLSVEKGLETLIGAWRQLRSPVPLKIVGDGPLSGVVRAACARNPLIEWLGRQPRDEVDRLMGDAAVLIQPSQCYETFGRVIVEGYARGIPVIASRHGAMAELVSDGRTGFLFTPGDAGDLASKVEVLLSDQSRYQTFRRCARSEFTRRFAREANYRALMSLYDRVLQLPATPK